MMDTSEVDAKETFQRRWMLENNIQTVDSMFKYDKDEQQQLRAMKPWERDPNYFKVNPFVSIVNLFLGSQNVCVGLAQNGHSRTEWRQH